jgi:asparagine synthase (glutamine-hydrolysing)
MCGICGFTRNGFSRERSHQIVENMCGLMSYRGPDDQGVFVDEEIALGHRRLSIIDLSPAGHQPMTMNDAPFWITFNGEIYNFLTLRKQLESRGARFRTATDTEVILRAYEAFGEDCVRHLNGMFAFGLWDAAKKKLLLARDRLGKKPLYFYHQDDRFIFASEIKAILAVPGVTREIDLEALNLYLNSGFIPAPWSIFKHIRKVREASYLVYQSGTINERSYWDLPDGELEPPRTESHYAEELESLLEDAVRCRLISDVPLGAFLSGGVDSSAIVAMMAKCNSRPVETFTINFKEKTYSELEDARRVANHCRTQHHVLEVATDAVNLLPKLVWHFDEPFADSSAIPTYYVSKMAREHVTVILSGDGGDELFAGYVNYLKRNEYQHFLRLPKSIRRLTFGKMAQMLPIQAPMRNFMKYVAAASPDDGPAALGLYPYIKEDVLTVPVRQELQKHDPTALRRQILSTIKAKDKLTRLQFVDTKLYLPGDILVKVDRMSMANSLETRAPLLDYRLVEFASRLPVHFKMQGGTTKYLLKKVLSKYVPKSVLEKRKHGFAIPIDQWFQTTLNGFTKEVLLDDRCRARGVFDPKAVQKILAFHANGGRDYSVWIWAMLNLELWCQTYMDPSSRRV